MMVSTGNDIVALNAINVARTKQPNFYKKIISETERAFYDQNLSEKLPFEQFVWLAWSAKESVFKYQQRINPDLIFTPGKITVRSVIVPIVEGVTDFESIDFKSGAAYEGIIDSNPHIFYSRTIITKEFIYSVVNHTNHFEKITWGVKRIDSTKPEDQSRDVRTFALTMLKKLFPGAELNINKNDNGCPIISKNGVEIPYPLSLAHHDHWVGYSFAATD